MPLGNFLRNVLGLSPRVEISPIPFAARELPAAAAEPVRHAEPPAPEAVLYREEIIDGRSRIAGYRFSAKLLDGGAEADGRRLAGLLRKEAVERFAQRRLALIPVTAGDWAGGQFHPFIARETSFLVAPPSGDDSHEAWLSALADMRDRGARVALTAAGSTVRGALDRADMLLLDLADYSLLAFEQAVARIKRQYPALKLLVRNVHSWPEHRLCQARGCDYSLGEFVTLADEEDSREKLNQSRLVLLEMLNLLRNEAAPDELASVAKCDPAVAIKVVAMANSPASGLSSPVGSVDQAIVVLGRAFLYRWLAISMFRVGGSPRDEALLEVALFRARFLELLAMERFPKQEVDELFLVGLLSLMDILLGVPIGQVVERMNLPAKVVEVLIRSDGPYGRYLMLALAVEKGRAEQIARLAAALETSLGSVEAAVIAAQQWSEEALASG